MIFEAQLRTFRP